MNEIVEVNDIESVVLSDNDGFLREDVSLEESGEERKEDISSEDESGLYNDIVSNVIDYSELTASIKSATPVYQLDTDLDELQITDVCLLIVILLLGIIIIGGKGK